MEKILQKFENWFDKKSFVIQLAFWFFIPFSTLPAAYLDFKKVGFGKSWPMLAAHIMVEFDKMLVAAIIYAVAKGHIKI